MNHDDDHDFDLDDLDVYDPEPTGERGRPARLRQVFRAEVPCPHCHGPEAHTASYRSHAVRGGRKQYRVCRVCEKKYCVVIESRS